MSFMWDGPDLKLGNRPFPIKHYERTTMTNTAANRPLGGEGIAALDGPVLAVIDQFWDENPHKRGNRDLEDLTPKEVLDIWLTWEGIQGYTEQIIKLIEDLGWKQKGE